MKIITFGICSINMLYPTFIPFFYLLRIIVNQKMSANQSDQIPFFNTLLVHCGQLLAGLICYIITCFLSKRGTIDRRNINVQETNEKQGLITILQRQEKKRGWSAYFLILMMIMLDGISLSSQALVSFYEQGEQLAIILKFFQLYATTFISKYILKMPFYCHQGLAIGLMTFGIIPTVVSSFYFNYELTVEFFFCLLIVNGFGISFYGITQKYLFEKEYLSLTQMLLLEGTIGFFLNLVFLFFMSIPCNSSSWLCQLMYQVPNIFTVFEWIIQNNTQIAFFFISIILSGFVNVFYSLTNKIYNPTHRAISDCLSFVFLFLYEYFGGKVDQNRKWLVVGMWIGIFCLILGNLVYCEYIILHFCGLGKNTKKEITYRSKNEIKKCLEIANFNIVNLDDR